LHLVQLLSQLRQLNSGELELTQLSGNTNYEFPVPTLDSRLLNPNTAKQNGNGNKNHVLARPKHGKTKWQWPQPNHGML